MFNRFFEKGLSHVKAELKTFFNPSLEGMQGSLDKDDGASVENKIMSNETLLNEGKALPEKGVNNDSPFGKSRHLLHKRRRLSLMALVVISFLSVVWISYTKAPPKPPIIVFEEKEKALFSSPLDVSLKEKGLAALETLVKDSVFKNESLNKTVTPLEEKFDAMERKRNDLDPIFRRVF